MTLRGAPPVRKPPSPLANATASGLAWQTAAYAGGKVLVFLATVALARLLAPEDFGLVALALLVIHYVEVLADAGVSQALVYLPRSRRRTDAALSLAAATALLLAGVACLSAPAVASFFGRAELAAMIRVLSVALLLDGLARVPDSLLQKEMRFRDRMVGEFSRAAIRGGISVALALAGLGAWSLVIGYMAGSAVYAAVVWTRAGHRPRLSGLLLQRSEARVLLSYGVPAVGALVFSRVVVDVDYLVVGKWLGAEALGYYTLAFRLPELVIINVFFIFSAVAFPAYSAARSDPDRLRQGHLRSLKAQTLYAHCAGAGLLAVAPLAVPVLFGGGWQAAVLPLQALALYAAFRSLGAGSIDVLKSVGRPGLAAALGIGRLAAVVPVLVLAAPYGIGAVALAQAGLGLVLSLVMQGVACHLLAIGWREAAAAVAPSMMVGAATGSAAMLGRLAVPEGPVALVLAVALGLLAAAGASFAADRPFLHQVWSMVRSPAGALHEARARA